MKNKFTFLGENRISATLVSGEYIWLAFLGEDNICSLQKNSVHNPNMIYWDVSVVGDEIISMIEDTTYLYGALDDLVNIGIKITKDNPTTITYFIKDIGLTEKAIDLIKDTTYIYFLLPGIESGINTKIGKYNKTTRAYVETIDLTTVFNAKKIDIDANGVLWIVTNNDPSELVKVWYATGAWHYTIYTLS
jgi:hypothetical protein